MHLWDKLFNIVLFSFSIVLLSCSGSGEKGVSLDDKKGHEGYSLNEFEKSFDPSKYDLSYESNSEKNVYSKKNNLSKKNSAGFRIQIMITDNLEECQKKKSDMQKLFPEYNFYMIHEFPCYKLRMGDYTTRKEAEIYLKYLSEKKVKNIMIVPDKIITE